MIIEVTYELTDQGFDIIMSIGGGGPDDNENSSAESSDKQAPTGANTRTPLWIPIQYRPKTEAWTSISRKPIAILIH